jgi:hypothetical protein
VLLNASCAVTVKVNAVPAFAAVGALRAKCVEAAGLTVMALEVPVIEELAVSVAVMLRVPVVFKMAPVKVCVPLSAATKV